VSVAEPAGRELDAAVASAVMGWKDVRFQPIANAMGERVMDDYAGLPPEGNGLPRLVPRYGTMIQAAWEILEKLRRDCAFAALISGKGPTGAPQPWVCKVNREGGFIEERADLPGTAVCRAALKVYGGGGA
jgi:hypothetical protein